jgi:hypothetical protein
MATQAINANNRYSLHTIMMYQEANNVIPDKLMPFMVPDPANSLPNIDAYQTCLNNIIKTITDGDDPNDIMFRNTVKFYFNTLNPKNCIDYVKKMKCLDYSSRENIRFLASEMIRCAIVCPISVKGFNLQEEQSHKSVPEMCADIAKQFSTSIVEMKEKEMSIKFNGELLIVCQKFFEDFLDNNKALDEHNTYSSDNYKGFMTYLGLMYSRGIIPSKVIMYCIERIKSTMFAESKTGDKVMCNRSGIEINNFYKGYEHLINHVLHTISTKIPELSDLLNTKRKSFQRLEEMSEFLYNHDDNINEDALDEMLILISEEIGEKKLDQIFSSDELSGLEIDEQTSQSPLRFHNINELVAGRPDIGLRVFQQEYRHLEKNIKEISDATQRYIKTLHDIKIHHDDITRLNQTKKTTDAKNQIVSALRTYTSLTHNVLTEKINELIASTTH